MAKSTKPATASKTIDNKSAARPPATQEQRYHYVEVAAYYIAQRRGFDGGCPDEDWAQAELEIDRLLAEGQLNH